MTPGPDESCNILTAKLLAHEPFVFTKLGDAEIEWIFRIGDCQAEGEVGTPALGVALLNGWLGMGENSRLIVGDWQTASFQAHEHEKRYQTHYQSLLNMVRNPPALLAYESILLMRKTPELLRFWMTLKRDQRRKVFVGPERLGPAAAALGCRHVIVPLEGACAARKDIWLEILGRHWPCDLLLFASGRSAKMLMGELTVQPSLTMIDIGSAMDPLFVGQTRSQQIPKDQAQEYYAEILRG